MKLGKQAAFLNEMVKKIRNKEDGTGSHESKN
jgi:hypothetical protein